MTYSNEDPRPRLTVRLNGELKSELEEKAEKKGQSMSDIARKAIANEVNGIPKTSNKGVIPPYEKELREAWKLLDRVASNSDEIGWENALSILSQNLGKPQSVILERIIKPLENRGYLSVHPRIDMVVIRLEVRA